MKNRLPTALLAGVLLLPALAAPSAYAQEVAADGTPAGPPRPPTPDRLEKGPVAMNYFTMLIILAIVVGANLIPSKRGHQD